jgi:hypothetical protein
MSQLRHLIAISLLALSAGTADAGTITTFDASGLFSIPGAITVDVTSGTIEDESLRVTGLDGFQILDYTSQYSDQFVANVPGFTATYNHDSFHLAGAFIFP